MLGIFVLKRYIETANKYIPYLNIQRGIVYTPDNSVITSKPLLLVMD